MVTPEIAVAHTSLYIPITQPTHTNPRHTRHTALPISTCQRGQGQNSPEINLYKPRHGYDATRGRGPRAPRGLVAAASAGGAGTGVGRTGGGSGAQLGGAGLHGRVAQPVLVSDVRGGRERADAAGEGLLRRARGSRGRRGRLPVRASGRVRLPWGPRRRRARARAAHHLPRRSAASQAVRRARHARRGAAGWLRAPRVRVRYAGDDTGNVNRERRPGDAPEPKASSAPRAPPVLRRALHAAAVTTNSTRHGSRYVRTYVRSSSASVQLYMYTRVTSTTHQIDSTSPSVRPSVPHLERPPPLVRIVATTFPRGCPCRAKSPGCKCAAAGTRESG